MLLLGFVAGEDLGDLLLVGIEGGGGVIVGGVALVFLAADDGLDGFGFELFVVAHAKIFHDAADKGDLVVGIVDDEVAGEA